MTEKSLPQLKKIRKVVKGQFTKAKRLITDHLNETDAPDKLELIEDFWSRYNEVQNEIDQLSEEKDIDKEIEFRCNMEDEYLDLKIQLRQYLNRRHFQEEPDGTEACSSKSPNSTNINFTPYQSDESFNNFIRRLEVFLLLKYQSCDNKMKVYILLHSLTPLVHQQLYDLCSPENPLEKTYDELVKLLSDHIDPKPSKWALQHKFITRTQQTQESIMDFSLALKKMSVNCEFMCKCGNSIADQFLSLQFIRGLLDNDIRTRLLQDQTRHTYNEIVQIASSMEMAKTESLLVNDSGTSKNYNIHKVNKFNNNLATYTFNNRTLMNSKSAERLKFENLRGRCYRCGSTTHRANHCKFKDKICNQCKKEGHLAKVCLQPKMNAGNDTHNVTHEVDSIDDEFETHEIHNIIGQGKDSDKFVIKIRIEGNPVEMELDTGASVSSISYNDFKNLNIVNKIFKTKATLKTYTGEPIYPKGVSFVNCCTYNGNKSFIGKVYIINKPVDPIFGREWMRQIGLDKKINCTDIKSLSQCSTPQLDDLLGEFSDIFNEEIGVIPDEIGHFQLIDDAVPIYCKPRVVPYSLKDKIEQELSRLENNGIISKIDYSDWGTPIVPVVKPNGKLRLCADYKITLNKIIKEEKHPIPRIEEIFAQMNGGKYFCTLDISNAYLHMKMSNESAMMQTLSTHVGLYKVNRLMFGVKVAPALWQRFMDKTLNGLVGTQCFFDDIIIQGKTKEELLQRLRLVFYRLREKNLKLNREKCKFFQTSIKYLGHVIDETGLHKTQERMEAVKSIRRPNNVNELRTFLGLANYYNKFIKNLATLLYPLNQLLRKNREYNWTEKCESAFVSVKREITSDNVLVHFDPKLPLVLATDASPTGLGAVLSHRYSDGTDKPISFGSRSLTECERKYSQIDKEATGIFWGLKKFYPYCYGRKFILVTDHKPLVSIFDPRKALPAISATRLFNYAHFLSGFDYTVEFRRTTEHGNADCLSRFPSEEPHKQMIDVSTVFNTNQLDTLLVDSKVIAEETKIDETLKPILEALKTGESVERFGFHDNELSLHNGCILKGWRVVIPRKLQANILHELHIGHLGIVKMKNLARSHCFWKHIDNDIENMVKTCRQCCLKQNQPVKEFDHPWKTTNSPWERLHIDFAGPLNGQSLFIIVDSYTKWVEIIPTKNTTSEWCVKELSKLFITFGFPLLIVSDNGTQFTSHVFEEFLKNNGVIHKTTAPYSPSSNGQAERFVQTVKNSLTAMSDEKGTLDLKLQKLIIQLRQVKNSTGYSAYQLMFNRTIRTQLSLIHPNSDECISDIQIQVKREFNINERVQVREYNNKRQKWNFGKVVRRLGKVIYEIKLDNGMICKRHVNQILRCSLP